MDTETGQGFIRQRRNLISISLVLLFYQILGIEIKTLNIFGTTISIQNSPYVALVLWIMCIYFSLRYYQYCKGINTKEMTDALQLRMNHYVPKTAFRLFKKDFDSSKETNIPLPHQIALINHKIIKSVPEEWELDLVININNIQNNIYNSSSKGYSFTVSKRKLIFPKLKSWINLAFTTRFVTEYFLPVALAFIPIVIQIYKWSHDFFIRR